METKAEVLNLDAVDRFNIYRFGHFIHIYVPPGGTADHFVRLLKGTKVQVTFGESAVLQGVMSYEPMRIVGPKDKTPLRHWVIVYLNNISEGADGE